MFAMSISFDLRLDLSYTYCMDIKHILDLSIRTRRTISMQYEGPMARALAASCATMREEHIDDIAIVTYTGQTADGYGWTIELIAPLDEVIPPTDPVPAPARTDGWHSTTVEGLTVRWLAGRATDCSVDLDANISCHDDMIDEELARLGYRVRGAWYRAARAETASLVAL